MLTQKQSTSADAMKIISGTMRTKPASIRVTPNRATCLIQTESAVRTAKLPIPAAVRKITIGTVRLKSASIPATKIPAAMTSIQQANVHLTQAQNTLANAIMIPTGTKKTESASIHVMRILA